MSVLGLLCSGFPLWASARMSSTLAVGLPKLILLLVLIFIYLFRVGTGSGIYAAGALEIEALVGSTAHLDCKVDALHDKLVSVYLLV